MKRATGIQIGRNGERTLRVYMQWQSVIPSRGTVSGERLADGDRLMIQNQCGTAPVVGWPDSGISDPAIFQGSEFSWGMSSGGLHVTSAGGEYSMCWCSVLVNCTNASKFRTELGVLRVTGPATGQMKYCVSGQTCTIDHFGGYELANGDRIMISDSCLPGLSAVVAGLMNDGMLIASGHGTTYVHSLRVSAGGGMYSMCWCGFGSVCLSPSNFQVDAGNLTIRGPYLGQDKTCVSGRVCEITGFQGQSISNSDQLMLLDTCGTTLRALRVPNDAVSTRFDGLAGIVSWGPSVASAAGGSYRMCWCAGGYNCTAPANFVVDSGTLHMLGPLHFQTEVCLPGLLCVLDGFGGYGLSDGERIMALMQCGVGAPIHGFPFGGITNGATGNGSIYGWGDGSSTFLPLATDTPGGVYSLCWCPTSCAVPADFGVSAGDLILRGPHRQASALCAVGTPCTMGPWEGTGFELTDKIAAVRNDFDCMEADADPLVAAGVYKSVLCSVDLVTCSASLSGVESQHGGRFKICYCLSHTDPNGADALPCTEKGEFTAWAGMLEIRGPLGAQAFPCVVGINCTITVKGFLLDPRDRIKLVKMGDPCNALPAAGVDAQEPLASYGQRRPKPDPASIVDRRRIDPRLGLGWPHTEVPESCLVRRLTELPQAGFAYPANAGRLVLKCTPRADARAPFPHRSTSANLWDDLARN